MKAATFYPTSYCFPDVTHTYATAMRAISRDLNLKTTQMCMLNHVKDYDLIRIVNSDDDVVEIANNHDGTYQCDRTQRELRRAHNFFRLWENGEFDLSSTPRLKPEALRFDGLRSAAEA